MSNSRKLNHTTYDCKYHIVYLDANIYTNTFEMMCGKFMKVNIGGQINYSFVDLLDFLGLSIVFGFPATGGSLSIILFNRSSAEIRTIGLQTPFSVN